MVSFAPRSPLCVAGPPGNLYWEYSVSQHVEVRMLPTATGITKTQPARQRQMTHSILAEPRFEISVRLSAPVQMLPDMLPANGSNVPGTGHSDSGRLESMMLTLGPFC
jgi:hypothetical protein